MSLLAPPSQNETDETKPQIPWELTAACTRFVLKWSEELQRPRVQSIFDVLRQEVLRRQGLRAYGVKRKPRTPGKSVQQLGPAVSQILSGEAARSIPAHVPKLLSNREAA